MSNKSKLAQPPDDSATFSTPASIPSTTLKPSRWQLITASAMLAVWIAFLIAMAFYN
jgi:hypothetical protein